MAQSEGPKGLLEPRGMQVSKPIEEWNSLKKTIYNLSCTILLFCTSKDFPGSAWKSQETKKFSKSKTLN